MCITSDDSQLSNTNIAVLSSGDRQMTVYQNQANNSNPNNIMVLAVPNPETVEFHDLSNFDDFFDELDRNFPRPRSKAFNLLSNDELNVYSVGSYQVSIVPNQQDFTRLNSSFTITQGLIDFLTQAYDDRFGFVVCKLKSGNHKYHPMAYSHQKFNNSEYFIPTIHYHGPKTNHQLGQEIYDWSHTIYIANYNQLNTGYPKIDNLRVQTKNEPKLPSAERLGFDYNHGQNLAKLEINSENFPNHSYPNCDLYVSCL